MRTGLRVGVSVLAVFAIVLATVATTMSAPVAAAPGRAGDLVSVTDITDRPDAKVKGAGKVYLITYLSPDHTGKLIAVRGTVMVPGKPRTGGWRIVGYAHGTAGLGDQCTVTDRMGHEGRYDNWIGPWLRDGYIIAATEYAGVGSPGVIVALVEPRLSGRVGERRPSRTAGRVAAFSFRWLSRDGRAKRDRRASKPQ